MDKNVVLLLDKIEKDCLRLNKKAQLTEYGKGQLDLIKVVKKQIDCKEQKYSRKNLKKYPVESWTAISNLMIANELNEINRLLNKLL